MMSKKHTSGPLVAKKHPNWDGDFFVFKENRQIANCYGDDDMPEKEREANARLYAAAPDMLEFLRAVKAAKSDSTQEARRVLDLGLDEIIRKAEGDEK